MSYPYRALDEGTNEIRLLSFVRISAKEEDARIHLTLQHVAFDAVKDPSQTAAWNQEGYAFADSDETSGWGDYAAISYVWGDPSSPANILLDGSRVEVTRNLLDVLQRLKKLMIEDIGLPRHFWIDALCIDQANVDERNKQVPRMRHIYGLAPTVHCFLAPIIIPQVAGFLDEEGKEHVPVETVLQFAIKTLWRLARIREHGRQQQYFDALLRRETYLEPNVLATLLLFFSNPYWTRVWIIQEMALGHSSINLVVGNEVMPWANVVYAAEIFNGLAELVPDALTPVLKEMPDHHNNSANVIAVGWAVANLHKSTRLLHGTPEWFVNMALRTQAGNPRDKVHGLLSLLAPEHASLMHVEYKKPVAEVYTDFAKSNVQYHGNLQVLPRAAWPGTDEHFPTWVPHLMEGLMSSIGEASYRPGPRHPLRSFAGLARPEVDGTKLIVTGIIMDCIDGLSAVGGVKSPVKIVHEDTELGNVRPTNFAMQELGVIEEHNLHDAIKDVLCSEARESEDWEPTMFSMGSLDYNKSKTQSSFIMWTFFFEDAKDFRLPSNMGLLEWMRYRTDSDTNQKVPLTPGQQSTLKAMARTVTGRRLTVTTSGRIGVVPADARQGDVICAMSGLNVLGLIRRKGGTDNWSWIGDCYVHGLMDDEAATKLREDIRRFVIA